MSRFERFGESSFGTIAIDPKFSVANSSNSESSVKRSSEGQRVHALDKARLSASASRDWLARLRAAKYFAVALASSSGHDGLARDADVATSSSIIWLCSSSKPGRITRFKSIGL